MLTSYEEYAVLNSKIEALNAQKDILRTQILEDMVLSKEDKVDTSVGKFTVSKLKKWTYTDKVEKLNEEFKAQKAKEESTGEATYVEQPSLRFTPVHL